MSFLSDGTESNHRHDGNGNHRRHDGNGGDCTAADDVLIASGVFRTGACAGAESCFYAGYRFAFVVGSGPWSLTTLIREVIPESSSNSNPQNVSL